MQIQKLAQESHSQHRQQRREIAVQDMLHGSLVMRVSFLHELEIAA